jgi:alkanesulfonate monooxygenase SsuD/methylene tetrahydromethanopterin reductase-like flavin-dependent oxidoreductase (luciferase family)
VAVRFGILLPHFSARATPERLVAFAPRLEELGYDSGWVRDNLDFRGGHSFEAAGTLFVDPFTAMTAVAARTRNFGLGTAVLTPFRHPLVTAQLVGGLTWLAGDRIELGVGPGTPRRPWDAVSIDYGERIERCREMVEVLRVVAQGGPATYSGPYTQFSDVLIDPAPSATVPIWYGGAERHSLRRIRAYADGLLPGRCPFPIYDDAIAYLKGAEQEDGRTYRLGSIPLVAIEHTREEALARLPVDALLDAATERWKRPHTRVEDLAGALIAGSPDEIGEQLRAFEARGVELVVLDMRLSMAEFEDKAEWLAQDVLAHFGAGVQA